MKKISKTKKENVLDNNYGFTLIEVLVSLLIVSLLMIGLYGLIELSLRVTSDNSFIVEAKEIANQKMERIRNMRYDDVGTLTGSPSGTIQEHETINRDGLFDVHTMVVFYDDPYDGTLAAGTDSVFTDYKIVTIDVSWQGRFGPKKISVFSKIIPNTQETLSGYGLLKLITVNASGAALPNATVHVENSSPLLSADYISDTNGQLDLPLLPDFEGYEVTVSKTGYSTEKTYARDAINLNPTKPNLSIYEGAKTEESFSIDRLANLTVRTVANALPDNWRVGTPTANENLNPKISLDQDDNAYFAWQENEPSASGVWIQKYNSYNAKQWASDVKINTTAFQTNPDIATTKAGLSYVVWQDDSVALKQLAYDTSGQVIKIAKNQPTIYGKIVSKKKLAWFTKIKSFWEFLLAFGRQEINIKKAEAVSGVSIVQTKISDPVNNGNSITATLNSSPTAGNVLIAIAVHSNAYDSFSAPTNSSGAFTATKYSNTSYALDIGIWHKVVQAGDTKNIIITSSDDINGGVLMVLEISGLDTSSLIDVTSAFDQTGSSDTVATTGQTATASTDNSFAVAASAFADNDFNTPDNNSWSSGSGNTWIQQLWTDWSTGTDGSLAVATMDINTAAKQRATLTLTGGGAEQRNSVLAVFRALPLNQAVVSAAGSQNTSLVMPQTDYYLGGKFVITENSSSRNVTSIKLQEFGTVNAQAHISSVKLFYDLDASAPYDCAGETYNPATDAQFGSGATFDGADGFAQFVQTGGVNITTSKTLCLYPVISISGANNGDTADVKINNPSTDVTVSAGAVTPVSAVDINGSTDLITPADVRQIHNRLRKDDGNETDATWKSPQDAAEAMNLGERIRLRFEMTNRGGAASAPMAYRLEYGELSSDCDSISSWQAVPNDNGLAWQITDSNYYADAAPSTNVANGLTDENVIFIPGQLKDANNQTEPLALNNTDFTEVEYNLKPNTGAGDKTFCFRLTDQGDASAITYEKYAVVSVNGDENIYIRAVNPDGSFAWPIKRVNADTSTAGQTNPVIALTENLGVATSAVAWEDDRSGDSDIYLQVLDSSGNRKFATDLQVSASTNNDYSPALAFDSHGDLYVAWVDSAASQDVYLSKFNQKGNLLLGPLALKAGPNQEYSPKIKFDDLDNLFLTYTEEAGGVKKAAVAKYDATLTELWDKNPNIGGAGSNQYNCRLGIYDTIMFAVWNDERNGDKDIYAQKLDDSGNLLWANDFKVNIGLDAADQTAPEIVVRSNLKAISAWQDGRNGKNEIYAADFSGLGALNGVAGVPLEIVGTKRIGENPVIYKYDQIHTTDANGYIHLQLDWDVPGYSVSIHQETSAKSIILREPPQPLNLSPGDDKTMIIYVE